MIASALALSLLLQAGSLAEPGALPSYPSGPGTVPDLEAPGSPFRLTDLRFGLVDDRGTTQSFGARVKAGRFAFVGVDFDAERRTFSVLSRRTEGRLSVTDGLLDAAASFRGSRFILSADLVENEILGEHGFVFRPGFSWRLTPGLELLGGVETDSREPGDHTFAAVQSGLLYQRGAGFEATGLYRREHVPTAAPDSEGALATNAVDAASLAASGQAGRVAELYASASLRDTSGRFPRTEFGGTVGARLAVLPRLRLAGEAASSFEDGAGRLAHLYRGGVTWFARRQTLPRSGDVARRSAALARKATRLGQNERRADSDWARREQRMRLSLSGRAEDFAEDARALYQAQVDERDVPVLGGEFVDQKESLSGRETRTARVFVGVPWPPSPPWHENPNAVPFLRLDLSREHLESTFEHESLTYRIALSVALNRETEAVVRWSRVEPSALDVIHDVGRHDVLEVTFTYAYGR